MSDSILTSTKKILGIEEDYEAFDLDIMTHINSAISTLTQLGVGPPTGFMIEDKTALWGDLLGSDPRLNAVKTYVYMRCKLWFDPPQSSYAVAALEKQAMEHEYRLNITMEETLWTDPDPDPDDVFVPIGDGVLDGGAP